MTKSYLIESVRKKAGRNVGPSICSSDSQCVKTSRSGSLERGTNGHKRIKGRKRHIVVDRLGLILSVVVHAANQADNKMALIVLEPLKVFKKLKIVFADGGYRGALISKVKATFNLILEIVLVKDSNKGFEVVPKRWVVERTFSWFESYRRLSKDFEYHPKTSEAMIKLCMIRLMSNRLS